MSMSRDDSNEARRRLLARRLKGLSKPRVASSDNTVARTQVLSSMQQQIWLLQERYPEQSAYHITRAWRLKGSLDVPRLASGLNQLIARHDALRGFCSEERGQMVIKTLPSFEIALVPNPLAAQALEATVRQFGNQPFDLYNGPLLRLGLWKISPNEHVLVWVIHHLLVDEHSLDILLSELQTLYAGGDLKSLDEFELPFTTKANQSAATSGRQKLEAATTALPLVSDLTPPEERCFRGKLLRAKQDKQRLSQIASVCRQEGVTTANFWLALFAATLGRYGQQESLLIGVPFSQRKSTAQFRNVGLWLESLPVSVKFDRSLSFFEFCRQTQSNVLAGVEQQSVVGDWSSDSDVLSWDSKFRTMVVMESQDSHQLGELSLEVIPIDMGWSKFDVTFFVNEVEATLALEYDVALFDDPTMAMLLSQVGEFAEQVCEDPMFSMLRFQVPTDAERKVLGQCLGMGETQPPTLLPYCLEAIAKKDADQLAVTGGGKSLTYGQLLKSSRELAGVLQEHGVCTGKKVAIYLESGPDFLVAIASIHLAGGAYVPLDPNYPTEHTHQILKDLQANDRDKMPLVISGGDLCGDLKRDVTVIDVTINNKAAKFEPCVIQPEHPAYVIYTSGSTGKPKGVVISHGALAYSNQSRMDYYGPTSSYLLLSSFAFDSSVAGIFWSIASGGSLIVADNEERSDPLRIESLLTQHNVSHTLLLSGLWDILLKDAHIDALKTLTGVIVAGDVCDPRIVQRHLECLPDIRLFNEYGPTESAVWASVHQCAIDDQNRPVPIGRPLKHVEVQILNPDLKPVPPGAVGELCIGGKSLMDGYLGLPDVSHQVLIKSARGLLYRTGDLARLGADGTLHFHGRRDSQIKIRGFRVEPEDMERKLCSYTEVREAALTKRDNQLVAFFVASSGHVDGESLRGRLKTHLPRHLVPNLVIAVERLPRLSNGKLDRSALADLEYSIDSKRTALAGQSDATQVAVSHIWTRLLGVDTIRSTDDFFELGGDSLLGMQMLLELRRQFGVDVKIPSLFAASRLYQLAKIVRDASPTATTVAPIRKVGSRPAVFCVHAKTQFLLKALPEDYPIYLVFGDLLHQGKQLKSVQEVAAVYVRDLLAAQSEGPYYLLGFSAGGMIAYEMAHQLLATGKKVELVALADPPPFVNMSHWRFRTYRKLFHMRMAGGVWKQCLYLLRGAPGIVQRVITRRVKRAVNKVILETGKSMSLAQIEFGILQRYVKLGKTYQYPVLDTRCDIFVTDSHPKIVEDMELQWRALNGDQTTLRVISGAENHLDLMKTSHGMDLAQQFVEALLLTSNKRKQTQQE